MAEFDDTDIKVDIGVLKTQVLTLSALCNISLSLTYSSYNLALSSLSITCLTVSQGWKASPNSPL